MDVKVSTTMVNQGGRNRLTPSPASLDHSAQSYEENEGITFLPIEPNISAYNLNHTLLIKVR